MVKLSKEADELLDHMEFLQYAFLTSCPVVQELFKVGYLEAEMSPGIKCFAAECHITTAGIAKVKGLH